MQNNTTNRVNLNRAFERFTATLSLNHQQDIVYLREGREHKQSRLNQLGQGLQRLASEGLPLSTELDLYMQEWAIWAAYDLIIRSDPDEFDPENQTVLRTFRARLENTYTAVVEQLGRLHIERQQPQQAQPPATPPQNVGSIDWLPNPPSMRNRIPVDLESAMQAFVAQLATASGQRPGILNMRLEEKLEKLNNRWQVLFSLAQQGMQDQLAALLGTFLQEWADKEAIELIRTYPGQSVDPTNPALLQSFWEKLSRQHQAISSELLLYLEQGRREREQQEAQVQPADWQGLAFDLLEEQRRAAGYWLQQGNQALTDQHQVAQEWYQRAAEQFDAREQHYWQGQQVAQRWSDQALGAVQQAQHGVKQMYDFAAQVQGNVTHLIEATHEYTHEMLPSVAAEAASQVVSQRRKSRLFIVIVVLLVFLGFLALGYVLSVTLP